MSVKQTAEQKLAMSIHMKAVWAARKARDQRATAEVAAEATVPAVEDEEVVTAAEIQCEYCSLYFSSAVLIKHQMRVHKGELLSEELLPKTTNSSLSPGAIVRSGGIPMKVPWTKRWIEEGWECENSGCKDPAKSGWRATSPDGTSLSCGVCGQPLKKMFQMIDWDAPENAPHAVTYQGVRYDIQIGDMNHIPDVIAAIARESIRAGRAIPLLNANQEGVAGRLRQTGFLPPIGEEDEATEQLISQ